MSSHGVFLTWNNSRRSSSICARLDLERVLIVGGRRGFARHVLGALATLVFLARRRPELVWFQFSLVLAVILSVYARMSRAGRVQLVADLHTKAMRRSGPIGTKWIIRILKRSALQRCLAVLVTNAENARYVEEFLEVRALVLPDPLPQVPVPTHKHPTATPGHPDVAFICSFADDEPISLMIEAADQLFGEAQVVFTGNPSSARSSISQEIERVAGFTGFLADEDYWQLLRSTPCVVVLSNEPACLPCGAYESIAIGKQPIIAADRYARELFGPLAIYTQLQAQALTEAIRVKLANSSEPPKVNFVAAYERRWQKDWQCVEQWLAGHGVLRVAARR
jgi:hypothetical protein